MKILIALSLLLCTSLVAAELPKPTDEPILTIAGLIQNSNSEGAADFDLKMLQAMPQHTIVTRHPWVESRHHYKGPKVSDLLEMAGARSTKLTLVALNNYEVEIEFDDIAEFEPILAWSDNDRVMRVRDKGPLWLMLPIDKHPELLQMPYNDFMIWQLRSIIVK
ncbi:molybdopterin-binding oxidoreductase [Agarivorans sp. Toyoura001]|uniref:molybdopterin-binding oxidoreductase n=1 Tax=Agarivorans sp. Toyoura001 TaxID=2283141 RepID=UPI0010F0CB05|nr:molybdopterin-binding oxidoreductase [Agarivorans sp. Toyoura001]GDY27212.1 molybdopterin-binding oxidoreductase [Agarivorans sp. Toyoura001]